MPYILKADKLESQSNKVTKLDNSVTDDQYPSAKAVYDALGSGVPGSSSGVGEAIENGGEIFNDYENNKALSQYSHAEGVQTIAGTYAFNIISWDESNKTYTLDSIEGLEANDIFSIKWNTSHINCGKLTAIDAENNTITVDNLIINSEDFETKKLFVIDKPNVGTSPFDEAAHTEGSHTQAVLYASHAEGGETKALDRYAHAEGRDTQAGYSAHSEGRGTKALGEMSHAEGGETKALGHYSHAEGYKTQALSIGSGLGASHAEGGETIADGQRSHAEGSKSETRGFASHAEGLSTKAFGQASHAEGASTIAGTYAFNILAWDKSNKTYTLDSVEGLKVNDVFSIKWNTSHINYGKITAIEGNTITVDNIRINAEDFETKKLFIIKKPMIGTEPLGYAAHSEGIATKANGDNSHAEGNQTTASGQSSHSEGELSDSTALASHAEGYQSQAGGAASHAEGTRTRALNERAHAEGGETLASGRMSHAEGDHTVAKGESSHAEGIGVTSSTKNPLGGYLPDENYGALGKASHAEGGYTTATGEYSHAGGLRTKATAQAQTSIGKYNAENKSALFIVGNGTGDSESERKNAFVVKNNGSAEIQMVSVSPNSVVNKEYVDSAIGDIETVLDSIIAIQNSFIGGATE